VTEQWETVPIACTLDAGNLRERLEWIADLNARALRGWRHDDLRLTLDYEAGAIEEVRQMVANEQACCAFLTFDIVEMGGTIRLTIIAPEDARDAAEALFEPFASKTATAAKDCGCVGACGA
jgi:hypothetical protein